MEKVKIVECPRDAMQGLKDFIPTEKKVDYIQGLLECDFDTLDFGSFVSPKAIPQMVDTKEVLAQLDLSQTKTKLLAIIANEKGADDAVSYDEISYLGYPFSISETFQLRNTNATIEQSLHRLDAVQNKCIQRNKELVTYISMGFGNPYGDAWNSDIVFQWAERLNKEFAIKILALSDTIGAADPDLVSYLFKNLIHDLPQVEIGAHLHVVPQNAQAIIEAAYNNGCRRFDGAIKGYGGCPMAADDLTGNMPTEQLLDYFQKINALTGVNQTAFDHSLMASSLVFPLH